MGVFSNKIDRKQLKPGDHIYSWRKACLFAHHGIYVNEQMIIHFTTGARQQQTGKPTFFNRLLTCSAPSFDTNNIPCPICSDCGETRTNGVILSCLDCFLSRGKLYLFLYDVNIPHFLAQARGGPFTLASSDPPEEVIYRAIYLLESGFGDYHVSKNNCENFAIYCKTGLRVITNDSVGGGSGQVTSYLAAAKSMAFASFEMAALSYSPTLVGCIVYSYKRLVSDIGYRKDVTKVPVERISKMATRDKRVSIIFLKRGFKIHFSRREKRLFRGERKIMDKAAQ